MNVLDLAIHLQRSGERDRHVAHCDRHGIPVDDDVAAFRIDDQSSAVVVPVGNAGYRIRQVKRNHNQRRRNRVYTRITVARELGAARLGRRWFGPGTQILAGPDAGFVIAHAITHRKPGAIHFDGSHDAVSRIFDRRETESGSVTIGQVGKLTLQIRNAVDDFAANLGDDCTPRNRRARQDITGICHVDTADRMVVMPRLLI